MARSGQSWSDPELARAAADVLDKITRVLPEHLAPLVTATGLVAPPNHWQEKVAVDLAELRRSIRIRRRLRLDYQDHAGTVTAREVRPLLADRSRRTRLQHRRAPPATWPRLRPATARHASANRRTPSPSEYLTHHQPRYVAASRRAERRDRPELSRPG